LRITQSARKSSGALARLADGSLTIATTIQRVPALSIT
jgi:hypothetical protein